MDKVDYVEKICKIHGRYDSMFITFANIERWTPCVKCAEIEFEKNKILSEEEGRSIHRENQKKSKFSSSGIAKRFLNSSFDNFVISNEYQQRTVTILRLYTTNFAAHKAAGKCMAFVGNVGTGKTHLACAMVNELIDADYEVIITLTKELINKIRSTWDKRSEESESLVKKKYIDADLLILDEVGVQVGTESEQNIIFEIINGRYMQKLPTIIISNFTDKEELESYLGVRSYDRLKENGGRIIFFNWESYRGNKK